MSYFQDPRALAKIDVAALAANFISLHTYAARAVTGAKPPRTIAVVKANAYGHGTAQAVPAFSRAGCDFFAVATLEEAIEVRLLAPDADILILGYTPPRRAADLARYDLTQTVFSSEYALELSKNATVFGVFVKTHLKIDSGMCRLGFSPQCVDQIAAAAAQQNLAPWGIYTHFPSADTDLPATRAALSRFLHCRQALSARGFSLFAHAAASAALLCLPEAVLDGARVGLALYGIAPVPCTLGLTPALTLTAPIVQIHEVPTGTPVGYGGTFVTARPSRLGTVSIGYGDGIARRFREAVGRVCVRCKSGVFFAPVAGNICMDQMMLDLTGIPAEAGDQTEPLGDIPTTAAALDTIPYEILTSIKQRVPRIKKCPPQDSGR
ncbi:MAG: alanine racemase [Clostridia bacterium]|nr:alanine racemase [Clostridia bacterium]